MYNKIKILDRMMLDIENGLYNSICNNDDCDKLLEWEQIMCSELEIWYRAMCYCGAQYLMKPVSVKIEITNNDNVEM